MGVFESIKAIKGYIAGVLALAASVSAFCVLVFEWDKAVTTGAVVLIAVLVISLAVLIDQSEKRNLARLEAHQSDANKSWDAVNKKLDRLTDLSIENQRSCIRTEMNDYIYREPENHDTILAYGQRYFIDLNGDWKETDKFMAWVDSEEAAGRKVHLPPALFDNITAKQKAEKK